MDLKVVFFGHLKKFWKEFYQEVEKNPGDWHSVYNFIVDVDERIYMGVNTDVERRINR